MCLDGCPVLRPAQSCIACSRLRRKRDVKDRDQTLMGVAPQYQRPTMILVSAGTSSSGHPYARTANRCSQHGLCQKNMGEMGMACLFRLGVWLGRMVSVVISKVECRVSGAGFLPKIGAS